MTELEKDLLSAEINPTANPHGDFDRMRYDGQCIPGEASTVLPTDDRMHADD